MTRYVTLLAVACLTAASCFATPIFWPGSGHWYELTSGPMSWTAASAEATSKGGYLVTIADAAEQNFVATTFASSGGWAGFLWIGFYSPLGDGNFVWVTGEPVTYTNWASGEPNNWGGNEWAVELMTLDYPGKPGQWNDVPGSLPHYGLIEYDNYIPEPATLLFVGTGLIGLAFLRRRKSA